MDLSSSKTVWLLVLTISAVLRMSHSQESSSSGGAVSECPWQRDPRFQELFGTCACSNNAEQSLSVHCQFVKVG